MSLRSRGHVAAALALTLCSMSTGCRADVGGWWTGSVGDQPATLVVEQHGSELEGEVCWGERCDEIFGTIEERYVELDFGCEAGCATPPTRLKLYVSGDRMTGEASLSQCSCADDPDCVCRPTASFRRCDGPCPITDDGETTDRSSEDASGSDDE